MSKKRHNVIPQLSTRITATVSVALVLLLGGIAAFIGVTTRNLADAVRESTGFTVILEPDVTSSATDALRHEIQLMPGVSRLEFSSAEVVLERWQKLVDEDITLMSGINPFSPEFEVNVTASHSSADSIMAIASAVSQMPGVDDVTVHTDVATEIQRSFASIEMILLIISVALLVISFVLITNTVRLTVYSRRFAIHTMKLVGATPGFIRKPFITANIINGVIAGLTACALSGGLLFYFSTLEPRLPSLISPVEIAAIFGGMIIAGIVICLLAAIFATNKYLSQSYDEMFS